MSERTGYVVGGSSQKEERQTDHTPGPPRGAAHPDPPARLHTCKPISPEPANTTTQSVRTQLARVPRRPRGPTAREPAHSEPAQARITAHPKGARHPVLPRLSYHDLWGGRAAKARPTHPTTPPHGAATPFHETRRRPHSLHAKTGTQPYGLTNRWYKKCKTTTNHFGRGL